MALEYITVQGTYLGADGLPEVGYVEFRPNVPLTLAAGGVVIPEPVKAQLDNKGAFSAILLATDNTDVFPYGWYWVVDEKIEHGNLWYLMTNTVAGGGRDPLDISYAYRPIGDSDQVPVVVQPGPAGVKGDSGTVSVDSTETGEPGTEALVIDLDPASTGAVLKFIIPKGEKGDTGPMGEVTGVGIPEIYAQPNEPASLDANVLWVDIDDVAGTGGAGGSAAEIYTQPDAPAPTGNNILWVDIDDVSTVEYSTFLTPDEVIAGANVTIDRTDTTVTINATGGGGGGTGDVPSTRNLIAGSGLTGGGTLAADRTFNVGAGPGIITAADAISIDTGVIQARSDKGIASGYAGLDGSAKVPIAQVPTGISGTTVALGDHLHGGYYDPVGTANDFINSHVEGVDPHTGYLKPTDVVAGTNVTVSRTADTVTINSSPGLAIVQPNAPSTAGLPNGTIWIDEDSVVPTSTAALIVGPTAPADLTAVWVDTN